MFSEILKIGEGKKVYQLEYLKEEQLIIALSGKQRQIRLIAVRALDGEEVEWVKLPESKGCGTFTTGVIKQTPNTTYCLCSAIKKQVPTKTQFLLVCVGLKSESCPVVNYCTSYIVKMAF